MNNKKNKKEEEKKEGRKEEEGGKRWCVFLKTYTVLLLLLYTHFHNDGISMLLSLSALPYNK